MVLGISSSSIHPHMHKLPLQRIFLIVFSEAILPSPLNQSLLLIWEIYLHSKLSHVVWAGRLFPSALRIDLYTIPQ